MRFVKVLFKIILVLLILIILGGYIFLRTFDLNKYKPLIAQITEEQLGRKLAINGNAELGISFVPTLVLNDVTFANAPWASTETMVSVEKIEITLAVLPVYISMVSFSGLVLYFTRAGLSQIKNITLKTAKIITCTTGKIPHAAQIAAIKQARAILKKNKTGVNISIIKNTTPAIHHNCQALNISIRTS